MPPVAFATDGSLPQPPPPAEVDPNSSSSSLSTFTLVLVSVVASVFLIFIFGRILRFLFSPRRSSSSVAPASLLFRSNSSSGAAAAVATTSPSELSDKKKSALIDSLPLFKLGSHLAALSKSSPDCAVCLRSFLPGEDLRLLPACCHAFHSVCLETWILSSPSCPLCRAAVTLPQPPLPTSEPSSAGQLLVKQPAEVEDQRNPPLTPPLPSLPRRLTYTIEPSSFDDHPPEEDIEAAVPRIQWRLEADGAADAVPPPGDGVATAAGGDSSSRGWLRDYMERVMSSSRSSSFRSTSSSFRFQSYEEHGIGGSEQYVVDLELNAWGEAEADGGGLAVALYRWIAGM